ncbi:unnamed protein product, partial [Musa textilis]
LDTPLRVSVCWRYYRLALVVLSPNTGGCNHLSGGTTACLGRCYRSTYGQQALLSPRSGSSTAWPTVNRRC